MESKQDQIFCSLDIETSGFDPNTSEILEVGFAFFKVEGKKLKITEEWTQVFKPLKPVSPQIFGLTGITQKELDEAPGFEEHREFIEQKLKNAVIVGHNVIFDINFLQKFGVKVSGEIVDTLDLVQWLLPTHHSYNLENLMHTFGIAHKEAHRALADSKAAIALLSRLLQIYSGFPEVLKAKIQKLILPQNFAWQGLFENQLEPLVFKSAGLAGMEQAKIKARPFSPQTNTVYNFSLDENYLPAVVSAKDKILLVVPKATEVLKMLQNKIADAVVFMPQQKFDANKLKEFLNRKDLKAEEVKFLLKVLVWQHTNWQTDTLLDLNLSFFGGQFKNLISGGEIKENKTAHTVACDLSAFLYLSENQLYKNRKVVICGLSEFETAVTTNIAAKSSWGYINYMLKSFYNPELNLGEQKYKETTEAALLAGDLFFGLTNALFQTTPASFQYVKINDYIRSEEKYLKIAAAAETYIEKLSASNQILLSKEVEKFVYDLKNFFAQEENRVKWIELAENRCAFISMPLEITGLVAKAFKPFASISFADSIEEKHLVKFFLKRLGLEAYKVESQNKQNGTKTKTVLQGDLFEKVKKVLGAKPKAVEYHCLEKPVNASDILDIVTKAKNLPAAVLFSGPLQVKDFYEQNYEQLKQKAALLTQTAYGGSNKIFRNFSIHKNALLLATDKFVLKALTSPNPVEPVSKLPVQTLILCRLPFDQFTHPYQEAVSASFPNAFEDYSLPRALYNFQSLIKFFYTPALRDIYIIDSKLSKPYARVFKDFWQVIPNATSKT